MTLCINCSSSRSGWISEKHLKGRWVFLLTVQLAPCEVTESGLDGCSPCLCSQEEMESESQALKISRTPPATNFLQRRSPLKVPVPSQTAPPAGVQMFLQVCLWRTLHVETATFSCLVPWLSRTFLALPLLSDLCFQKPYSLKWGCSVQPVSKSLSSNFLDISEETVILLDCRV